MWSWGVVLGVVLRVEVQSCIVFVFVLGCLGTGG